MHLAAYHFDGDQDQLEDAYERMMASFPSDDVILNVNVRRTGGITVYDMCPTDADFESFSTSEEFAAAVKAAGLPTPRIESVGEVRATYGSTLVATG